jgi:hypothetical protein
MENVFYSFRKLPYLLVQTPRRSLKFCLSEIALIWGRSLSKAALFKNIVFTNDSNNYYPQGSSISISFAQFCDRASKLHSCKLLYIAGVAFTLGRRF